MGAVRRVAGAANGVAAAVGIVAPTGADGAGAPAEVPNVDGVGVTAGAVNGAGEAAGVAVTVTVGVAVALGEDAFAGVAGGAGEAAGEDATAGSWDACGEGDAAWADDWPVAKVRASANSALINRIDRMVRIGWTFCWRISRPFRLAVGWSSCSRVQSSVGCPVRVRLRESFHLLVQLPVSLPVRLRVHLPIRWPVRLPIKLSRSLPIPTSTCLCREVHCEKGWPFGQLLLRFRLGLLLTVTARRGPYGQ